MYTVKVQRISMEPDRVGEEQGEPCFIFSHRTAKAAKRRLGSIIAGRQAHMSRGACQVFAENEAGQRFSYYDLRDLIRGEVQP